MSLTETNPHSSRLNLRAQLLAIGAAAVFIFVATCALAGSAGAVPASDGDTLSIPLGKKGSGLRVRGVKIVATSPAKLRGSSLVLPVTDVTSPGLNRSQLIVRGGFTLRSGKRRVAVKGLLLTLKSGRVSVTAKVGRSRLAIFSGAADASTAITFSPAALNLAVGKLSLTKRAAATLKKSLANRRLRPSRLGKATARASAFIAPFVPGPNNPSNAELPEAAAPLARPGTAVDITSASVRWWVRDSWVTYLSEGSFEPQEILPATAYPPQTEASHACPDGGGNPTAEHLYSFNLPFLSGWFDDASDTAAIYLQGGVRFYRPDRGIDITAIDGELELNGSASRSVFKFSEAGEYTNKRGLLGALLLGGYVPTPGGPNNFRVQLPASAAEGVFAGQYSPGAGFGCFDITFGV